MLRYDAAWLIDYYRDEAPAAVADPRGSGRVESARETRAAGAAAGARRRAPAERRAHQRPQSTLALGIVLAAGSYLSQLAISDHAA